MFVRPAQLRHAFVASSPLVAARPHAYFRTTFASPAHHLRAPTRRTAAARFCMTAAQAPPSTAPTPSPADDITGPAWVLEYASLDDAALQADLAAADAHVAELRAATEPLSALLARAADLTPDHADTTALLLPNLLAALRARRAAVKLLRNVATQASCTGSVDGADAAARRLSAGMQTRFSELSQAYEPAALLLDLVPDATLDAFLASHADASDAEYGLRHSRRMRDARLSLAEENLQTALGVPGHTAWGSLYTDVSSTLVTQVAVPGKPVQTMGLASAEALRDSGDAALREAAFRGVREAWKPHRETTAAALNAITSWRLDDYARRGIDGATASSLHMNRMGKGSLDALMGAIDAAGEAGRRALRVQARVLGKDKLKPWDLFAPAPVSEGVGKLYSYDEGIDLIASAVGEVDPAAEEFVRMMAREKWIEAGRGDAKRPGAYCTGFAKTRSPRVYLSDYNGRAGLLLTLAHELGHAFHSWQMRDLPDAQLSYPMNLAETASIFFETVVGNKLLEGAASDEERLSILWGEAESAATFLLNIPARFRFEEALCAKRAEGKLSADDIDDMMVDAWRRYYGDALDETELMGVFAQNKLHFYLTGISFYNWPYSFGYLFALGVYAEYERGVDGFASVYRDLLRDTGRMDAEDVVEKHLGGRIDDMQFWTRAIAVAERKVAMLEEVAGKVNPDWKM